MDLLPRPDQIAAAAGTVAHRLTHGSVADLRPMPRRLVDDGPLREVYRYQPEDAADTVGDPVLLVTPPAVPSSCYDLRRSCSLVEHLTGLGRATYLVEYGEVAVADRSLTLEPWVDDVLPAAVRAVSEEAGGRPVHLVGWSLGGILALLSTAAHEELPIATVVSLGAPVDLAQVPLVAPSRPLLDLSRLDRSTVMRLQRALGLPTPALLRWTLELPPVERLVAKPLALALRLDDRDYLAQVEAVDRFTASMTAYPRRRYGQLYHRLIPGNALRGGSLQIGDRTVHLAAIRQPVLVVSGATDAIAPNAAVRAVLPMLSGSAETRSEIVPGGHLGMLTGREARDTTWTALDEWLTAAGDAAAADGSKAGGSTKKKTSAKKRTAAARAGAPKAAPRKRAAAKRTPTATQTSTEPDGGADREAIGANTNRRYPSAGSRALAR